MTSTLATNQSIISNVDPDQHTAKMAIRLLQSNGIPLRQISIVDRDFQTFEEPVGFVTTGSLANDGAKVGGALGAWQVHSRASAFQRIN